MTNKSIWVQRQKYYLYEIFTDRNEAVRTAKWYKKRNKKNKWFILPTENGFWFPRKRYALYMTKIIKII